MPKSKKVKSNNKILIAIIILAVVIIGALGYLVFDKYNKSNNSDSANNLVELTEIATDQTFGTGLSIKYPTDWFFQRPSDSPPEGFTYNFESIEIISPDSYTTVSFKILPTFGAICSPGQHRLIKIQEEEVSGRLDVKYLEAIWESSNGDDYYFFNGLYRPSGSLALGSDLCPFHEYILLDSIGLGKGAFVLNIEFKSLTNLTDPKPEDIEAAMQTENYQIAKQIVKSLHIKE